MMRFATSIAKRGIWRLLKLFDAFDIPIEAQMNLGIYEHYPDIPEALRQRSHEILHHGITNSDMQEDPDESSSVAGATRGAPS